MRVRVLSAYVEVWHDSRCVARHERGYGNGQQFFNLEHYLEVLERKPGASVWSNGGNRADGRKAMTSSGRR